MKICTYPFCQATEVISAILIFASLPILFVSVWLKEDKIGIVFLVMVFLFVLITGGMSFMIHYKDKDHNLDKYLVDIDDPRGEGKC